MIFSEITFSKIKAQIETYLKQQFSKASLLYSSASPFGQILSVVENLFQLSFLYLKNTIKQFDISDPNSQNERIIRNAAILAGHIPSRNISATGTLKFTLKTNIDTVSNVPGNRITIFNQNAMSNKSNGLEYAMNLGTDKQTYQITNNAQFFVNIIQGTWTTTTFTGTGDENQTFTVTLRGNQQDVENFNVNVLINGNLCILRKRLYDCLPNENSCVVRTGFNGGIDIIFGNSGFGIIPSLSSIITVNYIASDGSIGNIFNRNINDWTFIDPAIDGNGNTIDLSKIFDVQIYTDISFGANKESIAFTKNLLPIVSNNFVLGLPQQYAYTIKRLGVFSHVNAYQKYGTVYIVATPNINLFTSSNQDYFSVDISAFSLNVNEITKIDTYLQSGGNIMLTNRYQITSSTLSYYIMNVFIITYSDAIIDSVNSQIHSIVSNYFLNLNKINRIPKSELISLIMTISEIASVEISFLCQKNENYYSNAQTSDTNRRNQYASKTSVQLQRPDPNFNNNTSLGLDPILGDIIFEPNELPIIRGGWYDRNGFYYSSNINDSGLTSINIINQGTVDVKTKNQS